MSLAAPGQEQRRLLDQPRRSPSLSIRPTQGALQRLIWYSRQGRVRLVNTLSLHERNRNAFCNATRVRLTAPAEANGPK